MEDRNDRGRNERSSYGGRNDRGGDKYGGRNDRYDRNDRNDRNDRGGDRNYNKYDKKRRPSRNFVQRKSYPEEESKFASEENQMAEALLVLGDRPNLSLEVFINSIKQNKQIKKIKKNIETNR